MDHISLPILVSIGLAAAGFASLIILASGKYFDMRPTRLNGPIAAEGNRTVFLFDGPNILDATTNARALLRAAPYATMAKADVGQMLDSQFPGVLAGLIENRAIGLFPSASKRGAAARIETVGDTMRLTLIDKCESQELLHPTTLRVMEDEIAILRAIGQDAPQLIWHLDKNGTVVWANAAYITVADQARSLPLGLGSDWPPIALFEGLDPETSKQTHRQKLRYHGEDTDRWFDVTSAATETGSIHFAVDAQTIVAAERQARVFVQTLSKTFAQLSTGLAIFDRSRKLVMFNPALMDLTRLSATFLSGQPDLSTFLDRLRDGGVLPEPKDYQTWRDEVASLESRAAEGTYQDTWSLSGGETYRVSGRPHPDGALAFLIEDISAEISLTRSFRAELQTAHAVIDSIDEAIVVFSAAGTLIINNATYDQLWDIDGTDLTGSSLLRELDKWQRRSVPTPLWDKVRRLGGSNGQRPRFSETLQLRDGRTLTCRIVPLSGGTMLIGFRMVQTTDQETLNRQPDANTDAGLKPTGTV